MTADTKSTSARRTQAATTTTANTAPAKRSPAQTAEQPCTPATRPVDRLTARDAILLHLIAEHKVLTTTQITDALFTRPNRARARIAVLREAGLVDTFQPAPTRRNVLHCVATAKALRLLDSGRTGRRPVRATGADAAIAVALRPDLHHLLGVNTFFCRLLATARTRPGTNLEQWLSEWDTAAAFPSTVRPDGFGRWSDGAAWCDFFLEYDTGTEPISRLIDKLPGYADAIRAADVCTPVLFWLPGPAREQHLHQALTATGTDIPIATAAGPITDADPAGPIWTSTFAPGPLTLAALGPAAAARLGVRHRRHAL